MTWVFKTKRGGASAQIEICAVRKFWEANHQMWKAFKDQGRPTNAYPELPGTVQEGRGRCPRSLVREYCAGTANGSLNGLRPIEILSNVAPQVWNHP